MGIFITKRWTMRAEVAGPASTPRQPGGALTERAHGCQGFSRFVGECIAGEHAGSNYQRRFVYRQFRTALPYGSTTTSKAWLGWKESRVTTILPLITLRLP